MNETKVTYDFPTEVIDLPSKGLIYPTEHPLSSGQIEIKYMTAKEEDILASQNLIKKGIVLDKLFESIIVTPNVSPSDIFIGDKNAILLATRILGYGANYEVEVTDPFTLERQKTTIDLSAVSIKEVDKTVLNRENRYEFETSTKDKLVFRLLTHGDELEITKEQQALEKLNKGGKSLVSNDVTTRLRYMILSVNGNSDKGFINRWIQNGFLARDTKEFRKYVSSITPDLDLKFQFTSDITGETEALDIPFGVSFFYPSN